MSFALVLKKKSWYRRYSRPIRVNHPLQGLRLIWDRLYETYGSPEMVESALFAKLESFPKIANRDSHRLRELGDLLMEIRAAKQDGDLMGHIINRIKIMRILACCLRGGLRARNIGLNPEYPPVG